MESYIQLRIQPPYCPDNGDPSLNNELYGYCSYIFFRNYVVATPHYPPQVFGSQTRIHDRGFHPLVRYNYPAGFSSQLMSYDGYCKISESDNILSIRGGGEIVYFVTYIALATNYTIFYNVKIMIDRKIFIPSYYWKGVTIFRFENVLTNENKSTCLRFGLYLCVHFCFPVIYKLVNIFVMLYFYLDTPVHLSLFRILIYG